MRIIEGVFVQFVIGGPRQLVIGIFVIGEFVIGDSPPFCHRLIVPTILVSVKGKSILSTEQQCLKQISSDARTKQIYLIANSLVI